MKENIITDKTYKYNYEITEIDNSNVDFDFLNPTFFFPSSLRQTPHGNFPKFIKKTYNFAKTNSYLLDAAGRPPLGRRAALGVLDGVDRVGGVALHQTERRCGRFGRVGKLLLQPEAYPGLGLLGRFFLQAEMGRKGRWSLPK